MDSVEKILKEHFGLEATSSKRLNGYDSLNYRIEAGGKRYVFKKYEDVEGLQSVIMAESKVLMALSQKSPHQFPTPIKTKVGELLLVVDTSASKVLYRLLSYVEGTFLAEATHTVDLSYSFGHFLATMNSKTSSIQDDAIKARIIHWDLQHLLLNAPYLQSIQDQSKKKLVDYFFLQYKEKVLPVQHHLRKCTIHNDANDWNVLVEGEIVSGIIDFGDMVFAPLINELAVGMTYVLMEKSDPVEYGTHMIRGYANSLKLLEEEVDLLYYLIAARLCMSVCNSAYSRQQDPENAYISISEKGAWELLEKWITINPLHASNEFRKAAGLPSVISDTIASDISKRNNHVSKSLSLMYHEPIKMTGSAFQYMYDALGNTYLDTYNNIPHVGHCHPRVVQAGQAQMSQLNTNTRYLYDELNDYATLLLSKFPSGLNKVFFLNSGSAASDLAIRLAMIHTGNEAIMVMEHGYHGNTRLSIDISHYKFGGKGGQGQVDYVLKAPLPDTYKGPFHKNDGTAGAAYAQEAEKLLNNSPLPVAAFIAEPVVGCGGQVPLAKGYLKKIYPMIKSQEGVCISDEVQTGFGRLGSHFWGFEMHDVVPDIVVIGKPIANGHPMAAVVTTDEIAHSFENGMEFFSSFGGNPVSCAIGAEVLKVIEDEELQKNAFDVGNHLIAGFEKLQREFPQIGDIRGSGLFLGVELVSDINTKTPNRSLAAYIKNTLKEKRILISTDGPDDNVLKIKPPLCFTMHNADQLLLTIEQALSAYLESE